MLFVPLSQCWPQELVPEFVLEFVFCCPSFYFLFLPQHTFHASGNFVHSYAVFMSNNFGVIILLAVVFLYTSSIGPASLPLTTSFPHRFILFLLHNGHRHNNYCLR